MGKGNNILFIPVTKISKNTIVCKLKYGISCPESA